MPREYELTAWGWIATTTGLTGGFMALGGAAIGIAASVKGNSPSTAMTFIGVGIGLMLISMMAITLSYNQQRASS